MADKIRVIIKEPGQRSRSRLVKNELATLQEIVGGNIECIRLARDLVLIVNEEGKLMKLEPNFYVQILRDAVVGTAVFAGSDEDGEFTDVPEKKFRAFLDYNNGLREVSK